MDIYSQDTMVSVKQNNVFYVTIGGPKWIPTLWIIYKNATNVKYDGPTIQQLPPYYHRYLNVRNQINEFTQTYSDLSKLAVILRNSFYV